MRVTYQSGSERRSRRRSPGSGCRLPSRARRRYSLLGIAEVYGKMCQTIGELSVRERLSARRQNSFGVMKGILAPCSQPGKEWQGVTAHRSHRRQGKPGLEERGGAEVGAAGTELAHLKTRLHASWERPAWVGLCERRCHIAGPGVSHAASGSQPPRILSINGSAEEGPPELSPAAWPRRSADATTPKRAAAIFTTRLRGF